MMEGVFRVDGRGRLCRFINLQEHGRSGGNHLHRQARNLLVLGGLDASLNAEIVGQC